MQSNRFYGLFFLIIVACQHPPGMVQETFRNPQILASKNGVLTARLQPEPGKMFLAGKELTGWTYNGQYCPPLLKLKPGDTLRLDLVNGLNMETNIHFHGFDVSPLSPGDNIFRINNPGETMRYEVILPQEHDAGTFWYHPHPCGKSEQQVFLGMSGGIIVDGLFDALPRSFANVNDRTLLLKDIQPIDSQKKITLCSSGKGVQEVYDVDSNQPTIRTVNGQVNPLMTIAPGETQLWRIINAGANIYYNLRLDGHTFHQVGEDGSYLRTVVNRDSILLPPGSRVEVLVQGRETGTFRLRTLAMNTGPAGDTYPEVTLATVVCQGQAVRPLTIPVRLNNNLTDYRTRPVTNRRTLTFTEKANPERFYINGSQFNAATVNTRIRLGSLEEWTLVNATDEMHTFHIHQTDFQVISINGKPVAFNHTNDVVNMLPRSTTKILLPFTAPYLVGKFVYHCHILAHEDRGMMQVIEVYN